jgi:hypothetical protein
MCRRHEHPERVGKAAVDRNAGHVRESCEPLLDRAAVQRKQAPALERTQRGSHVRGNSRGRAADLDRLEREDGRFPGADINEHARPEQGETEQERAAGGQTLPEREVAKLPGAWKRKHGRSAATRSRDRPHRRSLRHAVPSSYRGPVLLGGNPASRTWYTHARARAPALNFGRGSFPPPSAIEPSSEIETRG